jgi:hypothetical protein
MNGRDPDHRGAGEAAGPAAARELFERSVERIDVATGNRLRLMRRDALASSSTRTPNTIRRWLPAAGLASAALVVTLALLLPREPEPSIATGSEPIDVSETVFPAEDEAELYAWLGEAPVAVDPPQGGTL